MTDKNFQTRAYKKSPIALATLLLFVASSVNANGSQLKGPITEDVRQEGNIEIVFESGSAINFGTNSEILIESLTGGITVKGNGQLKSGVAFKIADKKILSLKANEDLIISVNTCGNNGDESGGIKVESGGKMNLNIGGNVTISTKQENAAFELQQVRGITSDGLFSGNIKGSLTITSEGHSSQAIQAEDDSRELVLAVGGSAKLSSRALGTFDAYGVVNQGRGILKLDADEIQIQVDHMSKSDPMFDLPKAIGIGNYGFTEEAQTTVSSHSDIDIKVHSERAEAGGVVSYPWSSGGAVKVEADGDISLTVDSTDGLAHGIRVEGDGASAYVVTSEGSNLLNVSSQNGLAYGMQVCGNIASADLIADKGNNVLKADYSTQAHGSGTFGNDGFGQSFAVYAYGDNETNLLAGKSNQLFGALYAGGAANASLTGVSNVIASFAVIENAGNLPHEKGAVISAVYAEGKGTHVELTGQNVLSTYADNTNEKQLERVIWAYDGANIALNGTTTISTNRYEISPNNLDIAVAAGAAVGLDESSFKNPLPEDAIANVAINYGSSEAAVGNTITGDILAAYAGHVSIRPHESTPDANIFIRGNLLAGNEGTLELALGKNGTLIGRSDDYFDAGQGEYDHVEFFNPAFSSNILRKGYVTLEMAEGSQWYVSGQSWLTNLTGNSGTIYLTEGANGSNALHIQRISGQHTFVVNLNDSEHDLSDMLYINEAAQGSETQFLQVRSIEGLENMIDGDRIRFATVNSGSSELTFVMAQNGAAQNAAYTSSSLVRDVGFYDVGFRIEHEDRNTSRSDESYDGTGRDNAKPGSEYVDRNYGSQEDAKNWYLVRDMGNDEVSDGGEAVLATARAAYWNAVEIDRLNKRLGDVRHAGDAKDGLWVRLRHDRIGTDAGTGDFRTHNTTYQFGYDHTLASDGGRHLFGAAIDYMDADTTYRNVDGTGGTDRFGITAYTTWFDDEGWYYDFVGRWGVLSNNLRIVNGSGSLVEADYDNHVLAASLEVGRKWMLPDTAWFFEPQAQVQFAMVTEASYSTNQGTRIEQDQINSAITRLGIRVGREFGDAVDGSFYAKADWMKEWHGHQGMRVTDATTGGVSTDASLENKGDWFDVGFGVASAISESTYFFADAEYVFGNNFENTWSFNAGVRWMFD